MKIFKSFVIADYYHIVTYWTRNGTLGVRNILIMDLPCVFLQVEVATESLLTNCTSVRLVIVVGVHVECQIIDLER